MRLAALLPMKANSDRVPGKNFKMLGDKPLFRWMLDKLLDSELIDLVVINTDAREQLESLGAVPSDKLIIRDRKQELCGDFVSMNLILEDDIAEIGAESYLMTHTTNPFLSLSTIEAAISQYLESGGRNDSLFSVNKWQTRFYLGDGSAVNHDPDNLLRTQDLEPWYEENSCLYMFSKESFKKTGARIGKTPILFESPALESVDIDTPEDWDLADVLAKSLFKR